jgi:type 1 glutamine amidotransferase
VVNIGNPPNQRPPERIEAVRTGIEDHLSAAGAILGVHSSATSLTTLPGWPIILGGRWVRGQSMHPPQSQTTISITAADHPITNGLTEFAIFDERYSYLETQSDITVLCEHTTTGSVIRWCGHARPIDIASSMTALATTPSPTTAQVM